jgi:hypothetical protein
VKSGADPAEREREEETMKHTTSVAPVATVLALVLGLSALSMPVSAAPKRVVTYHLFTAQKDEKGFAGPDLKDRTDSIHDFLDPSYLAFSAEKDIVLKPVPDIEKADVVIEVLGREQDPKEGDTRTVHLRVTVGSYIQTVDGRDDDGSWGRAARNGAKLIRRWIYNNYDQVVAGRAKK